MVQNQILNIKRILKKEELLAAAIIKSRQIFSTVLAFLPIPAIGSAVVQSTNMVVTNNIEIPTEEELTIPELNLSTAALRAGAFHLGKACEFQNNEFMLCRKELDDPRACLNEGRDVTGCAIDFFRKVKKSCYDEFMQYATCLDKSSSNMAFTYCRKTQGVFDKCMKDNFDMDRPDYGYFTRAKVHPTTRPAPPKPEKKVYPDATPGLPDDYPRPPAKYGARFHWLE